MGVGTVSAPSVEDGALEDGAVSEPSVEAGGLEDAGVWFQDPSGGPFCAAGADAAVDEDGVEDSGADNACVRFDNCAIAMLALPMTPAIVVASPLIKARIANGLDRRATAPEADRAGARGKGAADEGGGAGGAWAGHGGGAQGGAGSPSADSTMRPPAPAPFEVRLGCGAAAPQEEQKRAFGCSRARHC